MRQSTWRLAEPPPEGVAPDLDLWGPVLRQLLYTRGLRTTDQIERFLYPRDDSLHDPFLMAGMADSVERLLRALRSGELMAVYGDFDVDGLTATALLADVLSSPPLEGRVVTYLPNRFTEGYGLNEPAVRSLAERGVGLLITADCGVGAAREIGLAVGLGIDVIVTDHHTLQGSPPPAVAMLNPRRPDCSYPFKGLAGVGVAYKLALALLSRLSYRERATRALEDQLDLVALGTVADLAPLVGENRLLVKLGLERINRGARVGLRALANVANLSRKPIDSDAIGYALAPRLNAPGRMADARLSLDLLLASSEADAVGMAGELDAANRDRQAATFAALAAAREQLSRLPELPPAIVLEGDYPAGVLGLVAGRLAEEFYRPAFIIERTAGECRGSGRGIPGFDVVGAVAECKDLLLRFGGHAQAAGLGVISSRVDELRRRLEANAARRLSSLSPFPELHLDACLRPRQIGPALYTDLMLLEPFGAGNPRPLFYGGGLMVRDARVVGNGHLKLWLADQSGTSPAIGFNMGSEEYGFARPGSLVDCAFNVGRDEHNGTIGYEMVLKGLRPAAGKG